MCRANSRQMTASKNSIDRRNEVMVPYTAVTDSITVTVRPVYLDQQTDVMSGRFVFGYLVRITNEGYDEVQLLRRHWYIRDARGHLEEVEGEGVIGEQPEIGRASCRGRGASR